MSTDTDARVRATVRRSQLLEAGNAAICLLGLILGGHTFHEKREARHEIDTPGHINQAESNEVLTYDKTSRPKGGRPRKAVLAGMRDSSRRRAHKEAVVDAVVQKLQVEGKSPKQTMAETGVAKHFIEDITERIRGAAEATRYLPPPAGHVVCPVCHGTGEVEGTYPEVGEEQETII